MGGFDPSTERWLPLEGFEGRYEVSDTGLIRSLDHVVARRNGNLLPIKGRVLRSDSRKYGHQYVVIKDGGKNIHVYVHRAVLQAFVGPCPDGMECRHLDGNPRNNYLENLAWGTPVENRADVIRHGNDHQRNKTHCPWGHEYGDVYVRPGSGRRERICKECAKKYKQAWKQRRREQVA